MKSPRPPLGATREAGDPLVALIQVRDEQGTLGEELRSAVGNMLNEVPLEGEATVSSVRVSCVAEGQTSWPNLVVHWHLRPVAVFLLACGDVEELKEKHLKTVAKWMEDAESRQLEWVVAVSEGAQRGRGRSAFEKMRSEARGKREEQVVLWEAGIAEAVLPAIRRAIGATLTRGLRDFREHVRGLETRRGTEGWNCAQYVVAQEGLAIVLERAQHAQQAMQVYEEASRVLGEEAQSVAFPAPWRKSDHGLVSVASSEGRDLLYRSKLTVFATYSYLGGRQLQLALRSDAPEMVLRTAAALIRAQRKRASDKEWGTAWGAQAWREVAGLIGREHWAAAMALREASVLDGDWKELAANATCRRAAVEALYRSGMEVSKRVKGEGWHALYVQALRQEAAKGGQRERLRLWAATRDEGLLQEAVAAAGSGSEEIYLDDATLLQGRKWENVDEDTARVWLAESLTARVPIERPPAHEGRPKTPRQGPRTPRQGNRTPRLGAQEESDDEDDEDERSEPRFEGRYQAVASLTEVCVYCEEEDVELVAIEGQVLGSGRGGVLLEGPPPTQVTVQYRRGRRQGEEQREGAVRETSVAVARDQPIESRGTCHVSLESGGAELRLGSTVALSVTTRLRQSGVIVLEGGSDWLVCGSVRRTLATDSSHTLRYQLLPQRAGLLLLPLPRLADGAMLDVAWDHCRAVRVAPSLSLVCATRPGARLLELEDEPRHNILGAASPDPRYLRYSAPGKM